MTHQQVIKKLDDEGKTWEIQSTSGHKPVYEITAEMKGMVSTEKNNSRRWTELWAFETPSGKGIVAEVGVTTEEGEQDFCKVTIVDEFDDIPNVLGHSKLFRALYAKVGIERIRID